MHPVNQSIIQCIITTNPQVSRPLTGVFGREASVEEPTCGPSYSLCMASPPGIYKGAVTARGDQTDLHRCRLAIRR